MDAVNNAFRGAIDKISRTGYVEGWAASNKNHFDAVSVCILWKEEPIGFGVANLFRSDLLTLGIGHGWHAFRARVDKMLDPNSTVKLSLVEFRTTSLIAVTELRCPEMFTREPLSVDSLLDDSNLDVTDISSLRLCQPAINAFINRYGVEEFVDHAYCYILGRPADPAGQATYAKLIASERMAPLTFLSTLFNSTERQESKWPVLPPSDPGFVFASEQSS